MEGAINECIVSRKYPIYKICLPAIKIYMLDHEENIIQNYHLLIKSLWH